MTPQFEPHEEVVNSAIQYLPNHYMSPSPCHFDTAIDERLHKPILKIRRHKARSKLVTMDITVTTCENQGQCLRQTSRTVVHRGRSLQECMLISQRCEPRWQLAGRRRAASDACVVPLCAASQTLALYLHVILSQALSPPAQHARRTSL